MTPEGVIESTGKTLDFSRIASSFPCFRCGTRFAVRRGVGTGELLGVTTQHALRFFYDRLLDVTDATRPPHDELLYNASVLAHFATTSVVSDTFPACPASLSTVFDLYVVAPTALGRDPELVEVAASQCLLLTGFFEDQQKERHPIGWYADLGSTFFARAARLTPNPRRRRLMAVMSHRFAYWREQQHHLAIDLRERPLLIKVFRAQNPSGIM